jgi:hypothetical protein
LGLCAYLFGVVNHLAFDDMQFSNAFVQATLKEPAWTHLPQGFLSKGANTCLATHEMFYLWFKLCTPSLVVAAHLEGS